MKKLKNLKARLLSLSLAFAMVLSLAMGMAPMDVHAEGGGNENPPAATTTLTYEVVGGSGTMDSATLTVGEKFTLPTPSFEPNTGRKFYGWVVTDDTQNGKVESSGFSNVSIYGKEEKTYTATAYYGYSLTVENLPEGTTFMCGSKVGKNPEAIVVPEFTEDMMEGNAFMIMNESITSAPSFTEQNGTATLVQSSAGNYMYCVQNITGPVTLTYKNEGSGGGNQGGGTESRTIENLERYVTINGNNVTIDLGENNSIPFGIANVSPSIPKYIVDELVGQKVADSNSPYVDAFGWILIPDSQRTAAYTFANLPSNTYYVYTYDTTVTRNNETEAAVIGSYAFTIEEPTQTTYTITLDLVDIDDRSLNVECWGPDNSGYDNKRNDGDTLAYKQGGRIKVSSTSSDDFKVTVQGANATISEQISQYGQHYYNVTGIDGDATLVVNPKNAGGGEKPPADTHTHNLVEVPAKAPTCQAVGNNKYYTCECGKVFKADGTTLTTVEAETIPRDEDAHVWVTEKKELGHWGTCSVLGCNATTGTEQYPVLHTDANSDNKCDVCEFVVYHVTFKANGMSVGAARVMTPDNARFARFEDGDTFLVPKNCIVEVICYSEIRDAKAPGADATPAAGEGFANTAYIFSDFTRNTTIVLNPNPGNVEVTEEVETEAPIDNVEIKNDIDDFIENSNIFDNNEIGRILTGENAKVWLDVNELTTVPTNDKTAIENEVSASGFNSNITFFDASFFKQVGSDTPESISEPGMDIEISIEIPEDLLNTDNTKTRTYKLLRYHNGEGVSVIEGTFSNGKFTFVTNKFSTYAIIYKDVAKNTGGAPGAGSGSGSGSGSSDSSSSSSSTTTTTSTTTATATQQLVKDDVPKTGEAADYTTLVWTSILAIGVLGLVLNRQKRRQ